MKYILARNTGKGFITSKDHAIGHMSIYPSGVVAVSNNHQDWIERVGGVEISHEEATKICLRHAMQMWLWNNKPNETKDEKVARLGPPSTSINFSM